MERKGGFELVMMRKKSVNSNKLGKTSLSKKIFQVVKPILIAHLKDQSNQWDKEFDFDSYGTLDEVYAKRILSSSVSLREAIDKLEQNIVFLSLKDIPTFYIENGIDKVDYYNYHIENHYIRIIFLIDYTAKFIHDVFQLGIPIKKINVFAILENLKTKDTEPAKALKKFEEYFKEIETRRNIIIHQGNFNHEDTAGLRGLIYLESYFSTRENKNGIDEIIEEKFKKDKSNKLEEVIRRMKRDNEKVSDFVAEIYTGLTPYFKTQYDVLKFQSRKQKKLKT